MVERGFFNVAGKDVTATFLIHCILQTRNQASLCLIDFGGPINGYFIYRL